jgi:hypothetical protein
VTGIVEFLTARLDEDQVLAEVQPPWPWHVGDDPTEVIAEDEIEVATAFALSGNQQRNVATYIARHDPKRVLNEIAARRRVMARHAGLELAPGKVICLGCGHYPGDINPAYDLDECPELRDLALPFAEHPEYQERWNP